MFEFETFVYLPLQKTGSTFVVRFFERFCKERLLANTAHDTIAAEAYDPAKLYLVSVRNPLDQYVSLYSYGAGGEGGVYMWMRRRGYDFMYDGSAESFRRWLAIVLRRDSADLLANDYAAAGNHVASLVGFQTYRYLQLAIPSAQEVLSECKSQRDVRAAHVARSIVGFTLRTETLNADLANLIQTKLRDSVANLDEALAYLQGAKPVNASSRFDQYGQKVELDANSLRRLEQREWLLYELFGYPRSSMS
jgi:hypothetical protein